MEETLWDSANKLRGTVESSEYKHIVLGLIFLKFVSDTFEERKQQLIEQGQEAFIDMVEFYTMENVFYLPENSRWSFIKQNAKQDDIALKIDTALSTIDISKLSSLIDTINNINTIEDKGHDIVGRVYEYFLSKFAITEGKGKGEFYTPKSIVNLIANMIEPYKGKIKPSVTKKLLVNDLKNYITRFQNVVGSDKGSKLFPMPINALTAFQVTGHDIKFEVIKYDMSFLNDNDFENFLNRFKNEYSSTAFLAFVDTTVTQNSKILNTTLTNKGIFWNENFDQVFTIIKDLGKDNIRNGLNAKESKKNANGVMENFSRTNYKTVNFNMLTQTRLIYTILKEINPNHEFMFRGGKKANTDYYQSDLFDLDTQSKDEIEARDGDIKVISDEANELNVKENNSKRGSLPSNSNEQIINEKTFYKVPSYKTSSDNSDLVDEEYFEQEITNTDTVILEETVEKINDSFDDIIDVDIIDDRDSIDQMIKRSKDTYIEKQQQNIKKAGEQADIAFARFKENLLNDSDLEEALNKVNQEFGKNPVVKSLVAFMATQEFLLVAKKDVKIDKLKEIAKERTQIINETKQEYKALESTVVEKNKKLEVLELSHQEVMNKVNHELENASTVLDKKQQEINTQEGIIEEQTKEIERLSEAEKKLEELNKIIKENEKIIQEQKVKVVEVDMLSKQVEGLNKEVKLKEQLLIDTEKRVDNLTADVKELKSDNELLRKSNKKLEELLDKSKGEERELSIKYEQKVEELELTKELLKTTREKKQTAKKVEAVENASTKNKNIINYENKTPDKNEIEKALVEINKTNPDDFKTISRLTLIKDNVLDIGLLATKVTEETREEFNAIKTELNDLEKIGILKNENEFYTFKNAINKNVLYANLNKDIEAISHELDSVTYNPKPQLNVQAQKSRPNPKKYRKPKPSRKV